MKATHWEFQNRWLIFGLIFSLGFVLYAFDNQNVTVISAKWLALKLRLNEDTAARLVLGLASLLMIAAALIRTWASSLLHADVVYASQVRTATLVADGPYRRVRNPLYLANILMAIAMGAVMSRSGFFVALAAMILFSYRLILREEAGLQTTQGERYEQYRKLVPRLLPALRAQVPSSGAHPQWAHGFKAEGWYWGFALALLAFAITLNQKIFFCILGASLALFWISSTMLQKKSKSEAADHSPKLSS